MSVRRFVLLVALATPLTVTAPADAAAVWCDGRRATIVGDDTSEVIRGTRGNDVIAARGGSDSVEGRGGNDRICGGYGADRLRGGPGDDRLFGGPDRISVDEEDTARIGDQLRGGPGRDRLVPGRDLRRADDVTPDAILWDTAPRAVRILVGRGVAYGDGPDSFVATGAWVVGSRYGDLIEGSAGPDLVNSARGADVVRAGSGDDRVVADDGSGADADRVWGGPGADRLSSTAGQDELNGGDGDDVIDDMGDSADVLRGDAGDDLLIGEVARSTLPQVYRGGSGHDELALSSNWLDPTAAPMDGWWDMRTGEMVLDFEGEQAVTATQLEAANLSTFGATWDVTGTDGPNEVSAGSLRATTFRALAGNDTFLGSAFDDVFDGGPGADRSSGMGAGVDTCISVEAFDVDDCESVTP
jgi:Ca2+-binding RTX toxin-like protein